MDGKLKIVFVEAFCHRRAFSVAYLTSTPMADWFALNSLAAKVSNKPDDNQFKLAGKPTKQDLVFGNA